MRIEGKECCDCTNGWGGGGTRVFKFRPLLRDLTLKLTFRISVQYHRRNSRCYNTITQAPVKVEV